MKHTSEHLRNPHIPNYKRAPVLSCNWQALCKQLMLQWPKITIEELDKTGPYCHRIALLIQSKYGISYQMIENYLRNFERTMPLQ